MLNRKNQDSGVKQEEKPSISSFSLSDWIEMAFKEDLPHGDVTTDSLGVKVRKGKACLIAKQDMILSGKEVFESVILYQDPEAQFRWLFEDGNRILAEQNICVIQGNLIQLLKAERVALNLISHLSGISTLTRKFISVLPDHSCRILDTRKTFPGWRKWEKQAVKDGGGFNHRFNLSESILIKENHISIAGGIKEAVNRIRMKLKNKPWIEVEVKNIEEVKEAVSVRVERILLDNMSDKEIQEALSSIPSFIQIEVSGNMTLERVKKISRFKIDFISIGSLTHSAPSVDLSLLLDE